MTSIQIAIDAPYVTKAEYLRRSGMSSSTFDRKKNKGEIIVEGKEVAGGSVLVNMVAMARRAAEQAA
ncbi:hypothetical protein [Grimontia sp. NTOU-MAR1]|uniref:hypothetical protein n=1 Tax=Grimontia sp. NTOU-MAR1 TaxID=3111011 RepID=UPI002DBA5D72|nr:hypothetical protein [Grimontia sp. NTOU-MAR1]WRV96496.1 hypothetical protein VP504_10280 [Grimontia sp. NTOU-MAR1]